jgi:hypothetical protein
MDGRGIQVGRVPTLVIGDKSKSDDRPLRPKRDCSLGSQQPPRLVIVHLAQNTAKMYERNGASFAHRILDR